MVSLQKGMASLQRGTTLLQKGMALLQEGIGVASERHGFALEGMALHKHMLAFAFTDMPLAHVVAPCRVSRAGLWVFLYLNGLVAPLE